MTEPVLIGQIAVSAEMRLGVRVGRRGGRDLVDLRMFREGDSIGVFDQATKSGFALERKSVSALIALLRMAETHEG